MAAGPDNTRVRNNKLIDARLRLDSPSGSGEPMSTHEVAEGMNAYLWQRHLAVKGSPEPTIIDHRFVSVYEAGRAWWPSRHYRDAWRTVLHVDTDAELGFRPRRRRRPQREDGQSSAIGLDNYRPASDTLSVHRRTLITLLAGVAAGHAFDRSGLAQLVAGSDLFDAGTSLEDHWYSVAAEYGLAYLAQPRQQTVRDLTIDLAVLELALPRATSELARNSIHHAGAKIAALLAMACTDLGYSPEARHAWQLARNMSDASGSIDVQLWVRGQEALLGIYSGRPLDVIERLASTRLTSAVENRSAGKADLLSAQAQIFALQGRKSRALNALGELNQTFDHLPEPVITDIHSAFSWPEHRLRHTESFVHSVVGSAHDADTRQNLALELYPASRTVSRCQIEMHRSLSLVRDGQISTGIDHASAELENLAPSQRGKFVLTVANYVATAVPPAAARSSHVRGFRAFLSELEEPAVQIV